MRAFRQAARDLPIITSLFLSFVWFALLIAGARAFLSVLGSRDRSAALAIVVSPDERFAAVTYRELDSLEVTLRVARLERDRVPELGAEVPRGLLLLVVDHPRDGLPDWSNLGRADARVLGDVTLRWLGSTLELCPRDPARMRLFDSTGGRGDGSRVAQLCPQALGPSPPG